MNKKLLLSILFIGFNLNVESKIDLKKIANEVKSKIQKAPAKAAAIALGTIGTVGFVASIISNKTKPEELTYFHDKLFNTIAETNVEEKVNEFKTLSKAQRELKLGDVLLFEVNETQRKEDLKKNLVKITCKHEQDKDKKDLYLDLKTKMVVQLKDNKTVPVNFAKDTEPKKTYLVKTLSELAAPVDQKISHWSRHKNKYIAGGACLVLSASVVGYGIYDYKTGGYITAKIAEAARIKNANKMQDVIKTQCFGFKSHTDECLQAHIKLQDYCPTGSKNPSCLEADKNLKSTEAEVDARKFRQKIDDILVKSILMKKRCNDYRRLQRAANISCTENPHSPLRGPLSTACEEDTKTLNQATIELIGKDLNCDFKN